ncbi:hypothetical protein EDD15DRAFT_2336635 [Pisolithus albus]|nr:hypothetical protein EDD15DRAFT_2336635 [Pisolithus albus]
MPMPIPTILIFILIPDHPPFPLASPLPSASLPVAAPTWLDVTTDGRPFRVVPGTLRATPPLMATPTPPLTPPPPSIKPARVGRVTLAEEFRFLRYSLRHTFRLLSMPIAWLFHPNLLSPTVVRFRVRTPRVLE